MKKSICAGLLLILCIGLLSGCSKKTDVDTSTVFIEKKGQVVSVDVETLDKEYYDAAELETFITDAVVDYVNENGETVEEVSFEVTKENEAKLQMKYDTYEDYTKFNGVELYTGTVVKAQAAGYDFDTEFLVAAEDTDEAAKVQKAAKEDVLAEEDNKVAIIRANVDIQVPGKILYMSSKNTKLTGKRTVSITGEEPDAEAELTYIIYK